MKILNIIASLDASHGGPMDGATKLAALWRQGGHQVDFATLDHPRAPYLPQDPGVHPLGLVGAPGRTRERSPLKRFGYAPAMVPWLRRHVRDYDAVIVHAVWNYSTMAARRVLVGGDTAYFVFPHGALDPWFERTYPFKHLAKRLLWKVNEGPLLNGAAAVLFTTEEERLLAHGAFRPYRIDARVVGFGSGEPPALPEAQQTAFRAAVPALAGRRYLLFLSRIHPKKGCDLLIRAFARIAAARPDLDLVIAGPDQVGWRDDLQRLAHKCGVAGRIHWPGMIAGDVKWGAFRGAEAFVLPSHSENFGIVVAEALACARPVLLTDKVNLYREVVASGAGLVATDTQAGIDDLLLRFDRLGPSAVEAMASAARSCFERYFRFEATAERLLDIFGEAGHHNS